jgi:hypothetical protein
MTQRLADALLRGAGGCAASLCLPSVTGDATDAAQLGLSAPAYQDLALSPAAFRTVRSRLQEGDAGQYELLVSASAVAAQVDALQLDSADRLFAMAVGVTVGGKLFLFEGFAAPEALGRVYLYRLLLRELRTA